MSSPRRQSTVIRQALGGACREIPSSYHTIRTMLPRPGIVHREPDGAVIHASATDAGTIDLIRSCIDGPVGAVIADPPYGGILDIRWDRTSATQHEYTDWMLGWMGAYTALLPPGGAFYLWGGFGKPGFRPFLTRRVGNYFSRKRVVWWRRF